MYEPTQDARWMHSIDLAREADFDLGLLHVRPARCEVERDGVSETLQRRVMQVLVALAQARGSVVSQDDLIIRCWRGLTVSEDAIFRCISKLRKLAAGYGDAPYAIETVPGVGYRLTSSGQAGGGSHVEPAAPRGLTFRYPAWFSTAVAMILTIAGAAAWVLQDRNPSTRPLGVAVQPFEALSDSEATRMLARRIPNEVVNALGDSQIETVLVEVPVERKAAGSAIPARGLIVTGILRDDGPNVIVDVRIENGATRAALWSTEFNRDSRKVSDLPLEVAARVADIVNMTNFARSANPPLTDDSALTPLLQTVEMIRDTQDGAWAPMLEKAQSVVARHPEFAFGHSILASAYAEAAENIDIPDRAHAMSDAARREANLTLKLDPGDAGAYAVLSGLEEPYNYREQEKILLRGIKLARHPREPLGALYSYEGTLLSNVGRLRESLSFQLIAQATDEWGPPKTAKVALIYATMGNLPAARRWIEKAFERWPNHSAVRANRLYIAGMYEQPARALAIINAMDAQAPSSQSQTAIWQSFVKARAAHSAPVSTATIPKIREAASQGEISREIEIMMLAALGDANQAFHAANLALDRRQPLLPRFLFSPATRNMRQNPAFVGLAARMGLIRYWRETGKRPDFCTDPASRSDCDPRLFNALKS